MAQLRMELKDAMTRDVITFTPDTPVKEAAKVLADRHIHGAPVVDEAGNLVGVVFESDLIMQDIRLHFPTYIQLLDGYIYLPGSLSRFEEEFKKAVGARVADVMETDVVTIDEHATIEDAATLMVEQNVSMMPVMSDGKLVGVISKSDLVRAISRS